MKCCIYTLFATFAVAVLVSSCSKDNSVEEIYDGDFFGNYEVTVPAATKSVFVTYTTATGEKKTTEVAVEPVIAAPKDGKDVEPFGTVNLTLIADSRSVADVYYEIYGKKVMLLENAVINQKVSSATKADNVSVKLPEPKEYKTDDLGYTFHHSSGVVMFDDSWPKAERTGSTAYDSDYNDVVVDYDLEAVVVPDELLATEGWREQVKVVLHVRTVGGQDPARVGLILEGFDQQYVDSIEEYKTLDSWQNPHGELPAWTQNTLQENSLHYEVNPLRPCIEVGAIFRLNEANAGTQEYTRIDDKGTAHQTVFNPRVKNYWPSPKTEQYDASLNQMTKPYTLAYIQNLIYYNTVPGYVNVDGGLYTYTVVYKMKPRAEMSAAERAKALKNMLDAVNVTTNQNFFLVKKNTWPIHLKGYEPADFAVKGINNYKSIYTSVFNNNKATLDETVPYVAKNGMVWAFKCPTLTKHIWEKLYFGQAYPNYANWVEKKGAEDADWYTNGIKGDFLSCWW